MALNPGLGFLIPFVEIPGKCEEHGATDDYDHGVRVMIPQIAYYENAGHRQERLNDGPEQSIPFHII